MNWLVVLTILKIWKSIGIIIPNIWKNKIHVPNHQPVYHGDMFWWYGIWLNDIIYIYVYVCMLYSKHTYMIWVWKIHQHGGLDGKKCDKLLTWGTVFSNIPMMCRDGFDNLGAVN